MISIVIPLYNKAKAISSTLQSVVVQTYTDFEVLVINDGSMDGSEVNARSVLDERIRVIDKPNGGVCSARNRGIQEARGEYVALLDADDIWDEHYLEEQVKMIQDFPEAAMWGINFAEMSDGRLVRKLATGLLDGYRGYVENYFGLKGRISDLFCSSSVVIRKDVFDKVEMFDERIKYAEDDDMWWRIIATQRVAFYDRYMVFYQFDAENRALNRYRHLKDYLPYYVDKYDKPIYKKNQVFWNWINRWSAQQIRSFYFGDDCVEKQDARVAVKKLDYSVIPSKYRALYCMPFLFGVIFNKIDHLYHRK